MCNETQKVEKEYEEFTIENFDSSLNGFRCESDELIFEAINFNSGLLSFEDQVIECSIGKNQLKTFSRPDPESTKKIIYENVKKFKFVDCKFSDDTYFKKGLDSLIFENCIFESRCYINNQYEDNSTRINIKNLEIKKTLFKKNFKLHNTIIDCFQIVDTDFIKNADFFKSVFKSGIDNMICFNAINFHELALFGDTTFHKFLQFKYVTFKGYSHFRSATFKEGLDLEYANIEKEMNFFNIHDLDGRKSKKHTSQETYRIIKYQLQKVGNIIGANKYHSLELSKRRKKLPLYSFDYLVLFFHWITSNHSQNWILPLFWIFVIGFMTCWGLVYFGYGYCCYKISYIFKYISIVNFDDCIKKDPMIFVLNKVALGYLYYQFLTAIRKDTRK